MKLAMPPKVPLGHKKTTTKNVFRAVFWQSGLDPLAKIPVDPCMPNMNYIHVYIGLNCNQVIKFYLNKADTFK